MNDRAGADTLSKQMGHFDPRQDQLPRALALYSASLATADRGLMRQAIEVAQKHGAGHKHCYEVVLQSYLFLGFPRMLVAADLLQTVMPHPNGKPESLAVEAEEAKLWSERGLDLCRVVYGENYDLLRKRVESMAPEIFRWMIFEGYGKVLARPGLDSITRELCNVASLMMDDMPVQLHSHMRGALNVGSTPGLLKQVVADVGPAAGDGYRSAQTLLAGLGIS